MKVLFVSERVPWPLIDGGNLRTYHILKALSEHHQVTLLCHLGGEADSDDSGDLSNFCKLVTVPKPSVSGTHKLVSAGRALFGSMPYNVLSGWSDPLEKRYRELLLALDFDVVHYNHYDTAALALQSPPPAKRVFDSHNVVWHIVKRMAESRGNPLMRTLIRSQAKKMAAMEGNICRAMDLVLTCSDLDKDGFTALHPGGHYRVVDNGVDTNYFSPLETTSERPGHLAFTGAMGYFPNEDGMLFFHREVAPLLDQQKVPWSLSVVGSKPSERVRAMDDGEKICVTGFVDDVRPYMAQAEIMIVPLRIAGGTRLKILEAFAMGKAVISTPEGAEGINAAPGRDIMIADTSQKFADAVATLLTDGDRRRALAQRGRQVALNQYDWRIIGERVVAAYGQL
jgi:sugar transferase (PEP-CTERM/EpsH1 system associated)